MALGNPKYYSEFTSDQGVDYKITIYDEDWTAGVQYQFTLMDGFKLTYDGRGKERYQAIKGSKLEFTAWVDSSVPTFDTFVDGLNQTIQGRYKIRCERDDGSGYNNYWLGVLVPDLADKEDEAGPRAVTFKCTDGLSLLKDVDFDQSIYQTNASKETLVECLTFVQTMLYYYNPVSDFWTSSSTSFLFTYLGWYENSMSSPNTASSDPLQKTGMYPKAMVEVSDETSKPISAYDALEAVVKVFGARLFQVDGKWRMLQVDSYAQSTIYYRRYGYTGTTILGTGDVSSSIFRNFGTRNEGYDIVRLAGGSFGHYPALLRVEATYGLWTTNGMKSDEHFVPVYVNMATVESNAINLGYVQAITGAAIILDQQIECVLNTTIMGSFITSGVISGGMPNINTWVMLKVGSYYFDGNQWTTTQTVFNYWHAWLVTWNGVPGNNPWGPFGGNQVTTAELPTSGDLYYNQVYTVNDQNYNGGVLLSGAETCVFDVKIIEDGVHGYGLNFANTTSSISYSINGSIEIARVFGSSGVAGEANETLDLGKLRLGDGPTTAAPHWGRLRTWTGSSWTDDGNQNEWQAFGSGTSGNITRILCEQCIAGQRKFTERNNYNLFLKNKVDYRFEQAIKDSSGNIFVPNGYVFDALRDEIKGEWFNAGQDFTGLSNTIDENNTHIGAPIM